VPVTKSEEYLRLMRTIALPDYQSVLGNCGAFVLHEVKGEVAHFVMLSFLDSREAIAKFAGLDVDVAKYYEFDLEFLVALEPSVKHYEIYKD
jgi:hypothetical protein